MPIFKDTETGKTVEFTEDHASQVIRRQRNKRYVEIEEEQCPAPSAETESTGSEVQTAATPQSKPVGRPKGRTTQRKTNGSKR